MKSNDTILIITRNLPPLVGGMERLNWHIADELSKYAEVKVVGPTGAAAVKPENVQVLESPLKPLVLFMLIALCKAFWTAVCFKPNVIIAGSGLTAPLVWLVSRLTGAKAVVYLHGFDITAAHWVYQKIWVPFFKRMDCVIVNSTPTKILALNAGVLEKDISIVHPGVTLPVTTQPLNAIQSFKKKYNLEHKKILLSVGRLTTRKGLKEFVEYIDGNREAIMQNVIFMEGEKDSIPVEVAMRYNTSYNENLHSYVNNINTHEGGTHLAGFRRALTRTLKKFADELGLPAKEKVEVTGDDFREGLTAVISVKVMEPQFEGQTKTKLGNSEVSGAVDKIVG